LNKKTLAKIAVLMIIVFLATIILYPTMFNPEMKRAPEDLPPPSNIKQATEEIKTH